MLIRSGSLKPYMPPPPLLRSQACVMLRCGRSWCRRLKVRHQCKGSAPASLARCLFVVLSCRQRVGTTGLLWYSIGTLVHPVHYVEDAWQCQCRTTGVQWRQRVVCKWGCLQLGMCWQQGSAKVANTLPLLVSATPSPLDAPEPLCGSPLLGHRMLLLLHCTGGPTPLNCSICSTYMSV